MTGAATAPEVARILDRAAIERVLPHRGDILCVRALHVVAHDHFIGEACWDPSLALLQGHFPGLALVPGVLLVEAVAQLAGAGMLVADPRSRAVGADGVGLLGGIRKCSFRRPVRPGEIVRIEARTRRMSEAAATVAAQLRIDAREVAQVEIMIVSAARSALAASLAAGRGDDPLGTAC